MIKLEHVVLPSAEQMKFVIEGMRNPMNSWYKSDSALIFNNEGYCDAPAFWLGSNDKDRMHKLSVAGADHRKFMRMMPVMVRITAPLYWWKEFDTYKVGTVANSCSTMHKIQEKEFTLEDFSCEHLLTPASDELRSVPELKYYQVPIEILDDTIKCLNFYRELYLELEKKLKQPGISLDERKNLVKLKKTYWWQMIQLLPSSYNQKRTVMLNYEVLANIYESRKGHKLDEWNELCDWIESLPYSELIVPSYADKYEFKSAEPVNFDNLMSVGYHLEDELNIRFNLVPLFNEMSYLAIIEKGNYYGTVKIYNGEELKGASERIRTECIKVCQKNSVM